MVEKHEQVFIKFNTTGKRLDGKLVVQSEAGLSDTDDLLNDENGDNPQESPALVRLTRNAQNNCVHMKYVVNCAGKQIIKVQCKARSFSCLHMLSSSHHNSIKCKTVYSYFPACRKTIPTDCACG